MRDATNTHISVTLTDDSTIKSLNKKYLNRDFTTDVLSFNLDDADDSLSGGFLGDVVVNCDQARRQARQYGNDYAHEVAELVAHGVLHLLGVHHDDDDTVSVHGVRISQNISAHTGKVYKKGAVKSSKVEKEQKDA